MRVEGGAVRSGMIIEWEGKLCLVVHHEIRTPGNLRSFNQVELKDLSSGTKYNIRMASDERVERVQLEEKPYTYLFAEGDNITVMDPKDYEQVTFPKALLGDAAPFLQDEMTIIVQTHDGRPLAATLPSTVAMKIVEADPVVKGQTATSSYKPAILENGVRVMVPPFIETGTVIVVNTADATYVERYKASA